MQEILAGFNLVVAKTDYQTAKLNSLPKFLAIQYTIIFVLHHTDRQGFIYTVYLLKIQHVNNNTA